MQRIKSKLEFETEIYNDDIAKIAKRLVTKYTGNAVIRGGEDNNIVDKKFVKESWLVIYTADEQQFQEFLHTEFLKLIPVLAVSKDQDINTLTWPSEHTPDVLKTIDSLEAMPEI